LREDVIILNSGEEENPLLLIHIDVGVVPTDRIVGIDNNLCVVGEMATKAFAAVMQTVIKQKRNIDVTADCFILLFIQLFSLVLRGAQQKYCL